MVQDIESALAWLEKYETPLFVCGIGNLYTGMENITKSAQEANKALIYLSRRGKPGIILYQDIGLNRLFLNQ